MRSALLVVLLALGCGGRTEAECPSCPEGFADLDDTAASGADGSSSADGFELDALDDDATFADATEDGTKPGTDVSVDPGPPPTTCPKALPKDNAACAVTEVCSYVGCDPKARDTATCVSGKWNLVAHACTTAPDRCPATVPPDASPCALPDGMFCVWDERCIASSRGQCVGGKWSTKHGGCGGPDMCPPTIPPKGTTCPKTAPGTGFTCTYRTECSVPAHVFCSESTWGIEDYTVPSCIRSPDCPASLPAPRSSCSGGLTCVYPNSCGSIDYAQCHSGSGGGWFISKLACPDYACPPTPDEGATCPTAGKTCVYPVGDGCSIGCTCSGTTGWSCEQTPCGAGGGGK